MVKPGQARVNLPGKVLLGTTGKEARMQWLQRTVVRNTQRRRIVLPLAAEKRVQQRPQLNRGKLRQLQRIMLLAAVQCGFHPPIAQRFWRGVEP